jgi:hypothetical protein
MGILFRLVIGQVIGLVIETQRDAEESGTTRGLAGDRRGWIIGGKRRWTWHCRTPCLCASQT